MSNNAKPGWRTSSDLLFGMVRLDLSNPDLIAQKMQRRERLMEFLERHGFVDIHHPPAHPLNRKVSFEALSPLQVAQLTGNTDVAELLLEAGARPLHSSGSSVTFGSSVIRALSVISSGGAFQKRLKDMSPSKTCLKAATGEVAPDEVQTVVV